MTDRSIRLIPFGGLGEFGMNCLAIACGNGSDPDTGDIVVVDAGLRFADANAPGAACLVPDFRWLIERRDRIRAIVLTHAHEDHVGALPWIAPHIAAPIFGSPFTAGLVDRKLREAGVKPAGRLVPVQDRTVIEAGAFQVEFLAVTHSVPGTTALAIRTPAGLVVHSADFKLDESPVDGRLTDRERLAACAREGIRALLLDSTNAIVPGRTGSERTVARALAPIVRAARGRLFVSCFASHVHRIAHAAEAAAANGRRVCLLGRSLLEAADLAAALGILRLPPALRVSPGEAASLTASKVMYIVSGSQAEIRSSLMRLADGSHKEAEIGPGDTLLLCARPVPGNERPVARMLDLLCRKGVEVVASGSGDGLHVSGHAAAEDLAEMIALTRPRTLVPIHGGRRHLDACARIGAEATPAVPSVVIESGDVLRMDAAGERIDGRVPCDPVAYDSRGQALTSAALSARRRAGEAGVIAVVYDRGDVRIEARGVVALEDPFASRRLERSIASALASGAPAVSPGRGTGDERGPEGFLEKFELVARQAARSADAGRALIIPIVAEKE